MARHRAATSPLLRGRVATAFLTVGAAVAVGHLTQAPVAASTTAASGPVSLAAGPATPLAGTTGGAATVRSASLDSTRLDAAASPNVLPVAKAADVVALDQLVKSERMSAARAAREAEARRPLYVLPAVGTFTSGYGHRWGTEHAGIDIANAIGTPIVSVADGVVIDAGAANGFGLWVRVQNTDGTVAVYGHVDEIRTAVGQQVRAGDLIATMGNRGQSTGPHLHFEIHLGPLKLDPLPWLALHGLSVR